MPGLGVLALAGQVHDDHALRHTDLDGGQADARGVVPGLQHVIHQGAQGIVHPLHGGGFLLQHRLVVGDGEDVSDGHGVEVGSSPGKVKDIGGWRAF